MIWISCAQCGKQLELGTGQTNAVELDDGHVIIVCDDCKKEQR